MSEYKIQAVSTETRQYETKFGPMISYKLKLEGHDTPVELGQKSTTPAPQEGQTLNGHIEETQYGPKFKKEQAFGGGGGGFTSGSPAASPSPSTPGFASKAHQGGGGKYDSDPFTMYLSYAKDIAVAHITSNKGVLDATAFGESLEHVILGGKTLYDHRPGGPAEDVKTTAEPADNDFKEAIDLFDLKADDDLPADF